MNRAYLALFKARIDMGRLPAALNLVTSVLAGLFMLLLVKRSGHGALLNTWAWFFLFLASVVLLAFFNLYIARNWEKYTETQHVLMMAGYALVAGAIWGTAGHLFTPGLGQSETFAMAAIFVIGSCSAMPLLSVFPGTMPPFLLAAWVPFLFSVADHQEDMVFLISCVSIPVSLAGIALVYGTWVERLLRERVERAASVGKMERDRAQLKQLNDDQTMFFLGANHDLRQPLTAISGFIYVIGERAKGDPQIQRVVDKLRETVGGLEKMIDGMMHLAKITTGKEKPKLRLVSASDIASRIEREFDEEAVKKQVALRIFNPGVRLLADPDILERIILNLVGNAVRYTTTGGVLLAFRPIYARNDDGGPERYCSVEVWDTGIGIARDEQDKIFSRFYQGSNRPETHVAARKGYGLGLAVVKLLAAQFGAELSLQSRVGRGTCFKIKVRMTSELEKGEDKDRHAEAGNINQAAFGGGAWALPAIEYRFAGKTIAIVEDDSRVREALATALACTEARIVAGVSLADIQERLYSITDLDYVIADLHIGGELGTDVITSLRQRYRHMGSVIITGDADQTLLRKLRAQQFSVMVKPIDPPKLLSMIDMHLLMKKGLTDETIAI